jgi:hypothetical protein
MIDQALELAIVFRTGLEFFLRLNEDQLRALYERAVVTVNRVRAAEGGE